MTDKTAQIAFDDAAPQDERIDALGQLQKSHMPTLKDALLPQDAVKDVIDYIVNDLEEQEFNKAFRKQNIIPFPSKNTGKPGMQSVWIDDMQISVMGDYYEKPSALSFDAMRAMVDQTPILNAVILTRIRQVKRFCSVQESGEGPGFTVRHIDKDHQTSKDEQESIKLLNRFFENCGWEFNPRSRRRLKRDNFSQFMAKLVRDSLTMDSCAIETEMKKNRKLGIDGLYAVDGATIRLCTEDGYQGDDEIFALQVVDGRIRSAYTYDDLIYEPRNPRSDVRCGGYGIGEVELLVRVVTGFLNALTYNTKFFDSNSIPKGLLHLTGAYDEKDLNAFKRFWNAMVKGVNNAWALPVLVSKDQESKAGFEKFGVDVNEMMFSKWMTFLTSIICAIYGMSPSEINFDSFSGGNTSPLAGSDTAEKLAASKDLGLRPLLSYFESIFSDFIVSEFSDKYVFRWTGIDEEDQEKRYEMRKTVLTVNEIRAQEGYDAIKESWGDAPVNPSLLGVWQQEQMANQPQDFGGQPGQDGEPFDNDNQKQNAGADKARGDENEATKPDDQKDEDGESDDKNEEEDFGKAFPAIYTLDV